MSSEKRIAASRRNGALSRGPKTPAGKDISSRNAVRHGLLAKIIVLEEEPDDAFKELFYAYAERFGPLDQVEIGMIEEMVATYWRLRRAWAIENRYFDTAMAVQQGPSPTDRLMSAFSSLSDANHLNLIHRYETRLHMMFQRAFRNLLTLRQLPKHPAIPNEPKKSPVINEPAAAEPRTDLQ
jgi:hypothetical protein